MSRVFEGWIEDLSKVSDYSYEFLVDVWNIANYNNRGDWIDSFTSITLDKGWWNLFDFNVSEPLWVQSIHDGFIYDGVIDDIIEDTQSLLVVYYDDGGERIDVVSFEDYVSTLAEVLHRESTE